MSAGWTALHLDDVATLGFSEPGLPNWKPLRHALGVGAFGVNAWVAGPGDQLIERHDELVDCGCDGVTPPGHEELYVLVAGAADFTVGEDTFPVHAGSVVFIRDPALVREAIAREPGTTVLTVGAARGVAFEPSEWETRFLGEAKELDPGSSPRR
jgi:hypothetical protein